jgi:hypothetical protein
MFAAVESARAQSTAEKLAALYNTDGAGQNGDVRLTQYADDTTDAGTADAYVARMAEPAAKPKPKPAPRPAPRSDTLAGMFDRGTGLAGTPNMFGDFLNLGGQIVVDDMIAGAHAAAPLLGGARRVKICENNSSLPQDRVYFMYNHFENALVADASQFVVDPARRGFAVDRYTVGLEKTFRDQLWSAELRMPFTGQLDFQTTNFSTTGGQIGNLALILKRKIYENECTVMAAGLGLDFPTGSDAYGHVNITDWRIHNQAVHLAPYIGLLRTPNDCFFWQAFLQIDVPLNGNAVDYDDLYTGAGRFGILDDQTLLFGDLELGYWLYRNPCACRLTGLAAVLEFHYAATLQDADIVTGAGTMTSFAFGNAANRVDETNVTVGLHSEFANRTLCRVGAVFPLSWGDNRSFDTEVQVQLERRF